jgi:hypothetical protein
MYSIDIHSELQIFKKNEYKSPLIRLRVAATAEHGRGFRGNLTFRSGLNFHVLNL